MQKINESCKKSAFLQKTYEIVENQLNQDVICWHYDGIGFVINCVERFSQQILPQYFKHSNFASFIRQLNMYGFSKKRSNKSENYYFHPSFQRSRIDLLKDIQRKIEKKTQKLNAKQSRIQKKITSELSIQLQSKTSPKKQDDISQLHNPLSQRLTQLINMNEALLVGQFRSLAEVAHDLKLVKSLRIDEKDKMKIEEIYQQYQDIQSRFILQVRQKLNQEKINIKSTQQFETEQSLKQKKSNITKWSGQKMRKIEKDGEGKQ